MTRARVTAARSFFEGREGEVISRTVDKHGVEYVLIVFDDDPRPLRFDVSFVEFLDAA